MPDLFALADRARIALRRMPWLREVLRTRLMPLWRRYVAGAERRRSARYPAWARRHARSGPAERAAALARIAALPAPPLVSVLLHPAGGAGALRDALGALDAQLWPEWECWVCPGPGQPPLAELPAHPRLRGQAGLEEALAAARGPFAALVAADGSLAPEALSAMAEALAAQPAAWLAYADEDGTDARGRPQTPFFKPAFDPDLLLAQDYLGRFLAGRTQRLRDLAAGGAAATPQALALRCAAQAGPGAVLHLPRVLYHARGAVMPTADAAVVRAFLDAQGHADAVLEPAPGAPGLLRVRWPLPAPPPRVSLIIPTRDRAALLAACVDSVLGLTDYPDLEVLVCDNGSEEPATAALFQRLQRDARVRVLPMPGPFNYSRLNNAAAAAATGTVLVLLNNDTEVTEAGWLREMVSLAVRPEVGAVGARLLYPDGTLQHGGVLLGVGWPGGAARHMFPQARPEEAGPFGLLRVVRGVSAVTGACLAVRRALYEQVGGLDEAELPVNFNDVDFCLRLGAAGYRTLWTPHASLIHKESASRGSDFAGERVARAEAEAAFLRQRWGALIDQDPYWNPNLSLASGEWMLAPAPRERAARVPGASG